MSFLYSPLFSGSSGNSAILRTEKICFLIDAGLPGKAMVEALQRIQIDPAQLDGILITHEHSDHIRGAGILSRKYNLPIYANEKTWTAMQKSIGSIALQNMRVFETNHDFFMGDCTIFPFSTPHDASDPVGFLFFHRGKQIAHVTDLGHVPSSVFSVIEHADLILLESNHDTELLAHSQRPAVLKKRILSNTGHLSNQTASEVCLRLFDKGCRRFILGHLSGEANTTQIAFETTALQFSKQGIQLQKDVELSLAYRDRSCGIFHVF